LLGIWNAKPFDIELKPNAKPYHSSRPFLVSKIHDTTFKIELECLTKAGFLKKVNQSEWTAPTFLIPKKDAMVQFMSDFRELNKRIKQKPYLIPKNSRLTVEAQRFPVCYVGYYHIELSPFSKHLCTTITPIGKYE
jgi:hypothetical protein